MKTVSFGMGLEDYRGQTIGKVLESAHSSLSASRTRLAMDSSPTIAIQNLQRAVRHQQAALVAMAEQNHLLDKTV